MPAIAVVDVEARVVVVEVDVEAGNVKCVVEDGVVLFAGPHATKKRLANVTTEATSRRSLPRPRDLVISVLVLIT